MTKETTQNKTVTLSLADFEDLEAKARKFEHLTYHGVDNWCGWDDAMYDYLVEIGEADDD